MLIDFHTHCFPNKISKMAIEKLSFSSGGLIPNTDGTLLSLRALMKEQGVDKSVVLSIATNAGQQTRVNDFAASINNCSDIFAFGSVFPHSGNIIEELERIKALGLRGVKFHPDYQGFYVDDIKMKPVYKKISELSLITIFHAGADLGFAPPYGATPERMARALQWFSSPVIAAHWGGVNSAKDVIKFLCGKDVYLDTSFGYGTMPKFYAEEIIKKHGADKVLFGTDAPWHTPEMEMSLLNSLKLSSLDMEKITHKNAERLLLI